MKVEYLIGIIILLVVILLLIINYSKEGFTTDQLLHKNHSQLYQKKNNNVGAALIATNNQAALGSDTTGILGNIQDTMESNNTIVQKVVSDYPLEGGESGMSLIIKKCEAITPVITLDDCKKLDYPNINSTCGICLADPTNMGRNSEGSQWAGGLVLTASDRDEYRSQNRSRYGNNNNFLPDYIPTVGSCPAGRMVSTRAECERLQTQLMCQKSGTFDSSTGCSQCFKDGTYSIVDSSSIVGSGIIMVVGSGTLTYSEVGSTATTNPPIYLGLSPQPINLSGAEYTQIIITVTTYPVPMPYQSNRIYQVNDYIQYTVNNVNNVYRMQEGAGQPGYAPDRVGDQLWEARGTYADYPYKTAPPGFLAGYIQSPNGDGSEPMDLYRIILTDTITGRKPRVMGQINVNGEPLTKMGVGNGKLSMRLTVYSPFSFMSTLSQEATLCTGSPFITKPESARLLNSDPCYARGSGPGKYNLDCLQQVFQNNGCGLSSSTLDKSAFPATNTKGAALMINSDGTFRNISDIADSIYQAAMSTATGLGADGNQLELSEWSNVSKFCTGVTINSPCDANAANGPLSPDCIIYLWDNKGENKITGATYSLTSLARSLFSAGRINRFCTRQGTKAPINVNNVKNQANIDYWMAFGGVDAVKREMSKLHNDANTSLTNEDTKAPSILECYGIVPNPRVSYTSSFVSDTTVQSLPPPPTPNLVLWFDAKDPQGTGVAPTDNTLIRTWNDKSGRGNNATSGNGVRFIASGMGGAGALSFSPSDNKDIANYFTGNVQITGNVMSIFSIINVRNSNKGGVARIIGFAAQTNSDDFRDSSTMGLLRQGTNSFGPYRGGNYNSNPIPFAPTMLQAWYDGSKQYSSINGSTPNQSNGSGNFQIGVYAIGRSPGNWDTNSQLDGEIGEIRIYLSILSENQRQSIEGELAWKWGLQSSLPSSHPYKSTSPVAMGSTTATTSVANRSGAGWSL